MKKHHLLWLLTLAAAAAGLVLCLLTGRTLAHGATIALAAGYAAAVLHLTDMTLPHRQPVRVRRLSGGIFAAGCLALLIFYAWHFAAESTIFINDDSLYHYQQLELSAHLYGGLKDTWTHFVRSMGLDYTCLANLLLAPVFSLTDGTADGFGLAVFLMTWPLLFCQLRRIVLRLSDALRLTCGQTLLLCAGACIAVLTLPILHRAALWRQVNLLGLPLTVVIITLCLDMDFRRMQPLRWAALLAACVLLALLRRWFLFFLAGWLPVWGVARGFSHLRRREGRPVMHMLLCAALCAALGTLLLWPMLSRALQGNYTVAYSAWRKDGSALLYELENQTWFLGPGTCVLIAAGFLWGLGQRRSPALRRLCAMLLCCGAAGMLLFTRIQNMTYHQVTFLLPVYLFGLLLLLTMLVTLRQTAVRIALMSLTCAALLGQWAVCLTHEAPQTVSPVLPHTSLQPPVREDMADILTVSDFIRETCTAEAPALILMNSAEYDRLTFVTPFYPDLTLREKIALDRTALVSDGFPRMWFSARYILAPSTVQTSHPGGTVEKLTHWLLADEADRFDVVAAFPMDDFALLVMERREPVTYEEYEELLALFADEHALYPAVYGDRMGFFYGIAAGWQ